MKEGFGEREEFFMCSGPLWKAVLFYLFQEARYMLSGYCYIMLYLSGPAGLRIQVPQTVER